MIVRGLLLAAGAGSRMGRPKALLRDPDGSAWLARGVRTLHAAGCDGVTVVLGAAADQARTMLPEDVPADVVEAPDWGVGMSASLGAGLRAAALTAADAVLVTLVDLPDVGPPVCARVLAGTPGPAALVRATYAGTPGHPVLIGRNHWEGVMAGTGGDRGARDYLAQHDVQLVECGDLATGGDVDSPPAGG